MGISHHGQSSAKAVCDMPRPLKEDPTDPIVASLSFYHPNMIIAGACAAFSCLSIFALMFRHATHLSNPNEQLKIMRICVVIPTYAILSFISIAAPVAYAYLNPWVDIFQAVALGDFSLLMSEFITPDERHRDIFLSALVIPQKKKGKAPMDGVAWYRKKWVAIFQYVVVSVLVAILTDITEGANVYCLESSNRHFAHLWLNLIHNISLVIAVMSVLSFYMVLKAELASYRPLAKLLAFKLLVGTTFLIHIVYWILSDLDSSPLNPTAKMNYADTRVGVPLLIICIIMVPFSLFFHWAYSVTPYIIRRDAVPTGPAAAEESSGEPMTGGPRAQYQGGFLGLRAWLALLNPSEILQAAGYQGAAGMQQSYGYGEESRYNSYGYEQEAQKANGHGGTGEGLRPKTKSPGL